jgi:hypothetical protein
VITDEARFVRGLPWAITPICAPRSYVWIASLLARSFQPGARDVGTHRTLGEVATLGGWDKVSLA